MYVTSGSVVSSVKTAAATNWAKRVIASAYEATLEKENLRLSAQLFEIEDRLTRIEDSPNLKPGPTKWKSTSGAPEMCGLEICTSPARSGKAPVVMKNQTVINLEEDLKIQRK